MIDGRLRRELDHVSLRYRRLLLLTGLAVCWAGLAAAGLAALAWVRGAGLAVPGVALAAMLVVPLALLPFLLRALRAVRDPLWVARRIERKFPDLDARLLAALEQRPADPQSGQLSYLQHTVVDEAVNHARRRSWEQVVPARALQASKWAHALTLAAFVAVLAVLVADAVRRPGQSGFWAGGRAGPDPTLTLQVEPEDTSVERGTSLIVLARFAGEGIPADATLLVREGDGQPRPVRMDKSLDDPVFAGRVPSVDADLAYAVRHGNSQTRWYKATVFEHPELKQADAKLTFPTYTGAAEKIVEDTRSVTAVEGTKATLTFRLNKPVTRAVLVPGPARVPSTQPIDPAAAPKPVALTADPADPSVYTAAIDLKQSATYRLQLADEAGRGSKRPAELAVNVTANRPPDLKLDFPAKDVDVSPLEELTVRAKVWDDFGVKRVGLSYAMAGQPPKDVVLAEGVAAKDRKELAHSVLLEQLAAQPDQLLSYHFWAEDHAADGSIRRTAGDMFFAEVRPFEEIFRQGEQPPEGEPQQKPPGSRNAQNADEVAEQQKQIIAATWNVIRREAPAGSASPAVSPKFVPDATLINESQAEAREKAEAMGEKLTDARSQAHLRNVLKHMDAAAAELTKAAGGPDVGRLTTGALPAEQAAYQELLKLRAREHEVVRGKPGQPGERSASNSRRQRQLDQLKLSDEQNRYQQQRSAAQQPPEDPQQKETRQVLNRLRELAQRQEDLNRQMKEMQSALDAAEEQAKKEEIQRQLARLREQQREVLRDTDELRDRMDQPENQERMAEARQQLERTREDVRKAAESLEQGKVPEASAAGARAGERLDDLREEFRRTAAGQFNDAVDRMRQDARELDQRQQELTQQLAGADAAAQQRPQSGSPGQQGQRGQPGQPGQPKGGSSGSQGPAGQAQAGSDHQGSAQASGRQAGGQQAGSPGQRQRPPSLRGAGGGREQVAQELREQKKRLEQLLENMRRTTEEAETAEPLLSKQLYDAVREATQQRTGEAIDATRQLVDRGFADEAQRAADEAGKGVTKLREGVEQAARGVLGDETEALRRARAELDALAQELEREMGQSGRGAGDPSTRPAGAGEGQLAQGGNGSDPASADPAGHQGEQPAGPGGDAQAAGPQQNETGRPGGPPPGDPQAGADAERQARAGGRDGATRPSNPQLAQAGSPQQAGSRQGGGPPNGEPQGGQQPGGQPQGQQPGDQPGQPGSPQEGGQQAAGTSPGGRPGDAQNPGEPGQQPSGAQAGKRPGGGRQPGGLRQGGPRPGTDPRQAGGPRQAGAPREAGGLRRGGGNEGGAWSGDARGPADASGERGPFTGENFRQWSDRLRDVEEMVGDPRLRADAARIRERAKAAKAEADRHSKEPNWDVVRMSIGQPLAELRSAVNEELRRRDPSEAALVPIDRDPVPPEYAEQVRRYYERLGSGK